MWEWVRQYQQEELRSGGDLSTLMGHEREPKLPMESEADALKRELMTMSRGDFDALLTRFYL